MTFLHDLHDLLLPWHPLFACCVRSFVIKD